MSRITTAFFVFALLLSCFGHALAQVQQTTNQAPATATDPAQQQSAPATSVKTNDLEITADVTARELRFEVVPDPKVEFTGQPERETAWEAERQNLPRPVEPGVTYRNIGVQLKISSRFADIERIVAEAIGEAPMTDDTPKESAPPQPNAPPAATPAAAPPSTPQEGKP